MVTKGENIGRRQIGGGHESGRKFVQIRKKGRTDWQNAAVGIVGTRRKD